MMNRRALGTVLLTVLGIGSIIGSGTATQQQQAPRRHGSISNEYFEAHLTAGSDDLILAVINKTPRDIEIDWNKTLYIDSGRTSGGFMFEGIVYSNRHAVKPPDIVFAKSSFTKTIYPINLVSYRPGKYGGWEHGNIGYSQTGIYLTIKVGGVEVSEKIILN